MLPDSLELSGVVCLPHEEKTRSHLELIAGIDKKSNAINAKWGHSASLAFQYSKAPKRLVGGFAKYK